MSFERVAIIGLGLLGGSIGLAVAQHLPGTATTGYDSMQIPRVKGMRREVRRLLADRSRQLLGRYRRGEAITAEGCLLVRGLQGSQPGVSSRQ